MLTQPTGVARQIPSQVYRRLSLIYIRFHFYNQPEYSNNYFTSVDAVMSSSGQQSSITKLAQVNEQAWLTLGKCINILSCNIVIWNHYHNLQRNWSTIYVTFLIRVTPFNGLIEGKLLLKSERHTYAQRERICNCIHYYNSSLPLSTVFFVHLHYPCLQSFSTRAILMS